LAPACRWTIADPVGGRRSVVSPKPGARSTDRAAVVTGRRIAAPTDRASASARNVKTWWSPVAA